MRGWITVIESDSEEARISPEVIVDASRRYRGPLLITSLELDDALLARVAQITGAGSLSAAVNMALRHYVDASDA